MMLILWQSLDIHKSSLKEQIYIDCQKYIQHLLDIDESFNKYGHILLKKLEMASSKLLKL
jgi:GTP-dependent phosphoenolpyruvate carboxykinase